MNNLGPHGLPLIGRADWNDCLNLNCFSSNPDESFQTTENKSEGTKAESLMIAGLFVMYGRESVSYTHLKKLYLWILFGLVYIEISSKNVIICLIGHCWKGKRWVCGY